MKAHSKKHLSRKGISCKRHIANSWLYRVKESKLLFTVNVKVKSEEHAKWSFKLMVTVKQIRNWRACKSVLHSVVRSPCVPCRIPETVFNHHSLQIFQPVRKTVLHKSDFSFLSSCTFCPYCIKLISHNKSCLPVTQSIRVNS